MAFIQVDHDADDFLGDHIGRRNLRVLLGRLPNEQQTQGNRGQHRQQFPEGLHALQIALLHAAAGLECLVEILNGTITNDKFCMSRTGRLQLSWWRLPLRAREAVSKEVKYPSE